MSLTQLLQTNSENKNIKKILKECKKINKKELENPIDGIAPPLMRVAHLFFGLLWEMIEKLSIYSWNQKRKNNCQI